MKHSTLRFALAIGLLAGHLLHGNALLGMLVGIAGGLASGVIVDQVMRLINRRESRNRAAGPGHDSAETEPRESECIGAE